MKTGRLIAATSLAVLTAIVAASPAEAGNKHGNKHGRHGSYGHDSDRRSYYHDSDRGHHYGPYRQRAYRSIAVPSYIAAYRAPSYDPYYDHRVWSGPHHHYHPVYAFPVVVQPGVIAYAPHTYCNGHLYGRGDVVLDPYAGYVVHDDYYGSHYRWDDRVSGYVTIGGPNFRIGVGF